MCICTTAFLSIYTNSATVNIGVHVSLLILVSLVFMPSRYHSFFIHPSVDGHLGCFHVLAIVNSAAMNNGMQVFLSILVSSGYMPRSGTAGANSGSIPSFLIYFFKGISISSSIVAVSICIPSNSARGFSFLHTLSSIFCL